MNNRLDNLEKKSEQKSIPEMSTRAKLNKIIRSYANKEDISVGEAWGDLYQEFYYRKHINLRKRAEKCNMSKIDYAEENGWLEDLKTIAEKL